MAGSLQPASTDDELQQLSEINVTPFIDVILVLLIIFMIAAPLATVDIAVDLPASTAKRQPRPDKPVFVTLKADRTLALGDDSAVARGAGRVAERRDRVGPEQAVVRARRQDHSLWRGDGADERAARRGLSEDRAGGAGRRSRAVSLAQYRDTAKRDLLRWGTCFAAILGLHGAVAAALLTAPQPEGDTLDSVTAIDVDFTTESFKDAQARDVAPGEEQQQTDAAPPPMEKAELKAEAKTEPVEQPQPLPDEPAKVPPLPRSSSPR